MAEKILIIEDDQAFRATLTNLLTKEGYSVTGAGDGQQAINEAKKSFFELIVADVRLPGGMDGIEAVKCIKEITPQEKIMAIIITGYADENAPVRGIKVGIDDYLYKPFEMNEFLFSVERNLKVFWLEKEREKHIEMLGEMNEELKAAKEQLQDYSAGLEKKVEEKAKQLKQSQVQLIQSAKLSTIGWLGAGVAHELNNPIAGILGYAQFILRKFNKPDSTDKDFKSRMQYVEYIEKESKRCKAIVENLLLFSRKHVGEPEPVDIKPILEKTLLLIRHQLELQNIKLTINYEPGLPIVAGSVNQLQQVFSNIIINAQHSMPNGGELNIGVSTRKKAEKKNLEISFKDTGCGIPKQDIEKIFEPFFTTKQDRKSVGIGLAITHQIIQEHKGAITVGSEEGKGTTFTITLPVKAS